jgi:hypothetical protein
MPGLPLISEESIKANGREPKTCLGQVFSNKLGCFYDAHELIYMDARTHPKLKARPRFSPVSKNSSMISVGERDN